MQTAESHFRNLNRSIPEARRLAMTYGLDNCLKVAKNIHDIYESNQVDKIVAYLEDGNPAIQAISEYAFTYYGIKVMYACFLYLSGQYSESTKILKEDYQLDQARQSQFKVLVNSNHAFSN